MTVRTTAPRQRKRRHPLTALVVWLALALVASLTLLLIAIMQIPPVLDLDAIYQQGMAQGYTLCPGYKSSGALL